MKKLITILILLSMNGCKTINVKKTPSKEPIEGIVYKLPQTQLQIEVEVKTVTYTKSDCFDAMKDNFKGKVDKELITALEKSTTHKSSRIVGIEIIPRPIEDISKIYSINTSRKLLQNRTFGFTFDDRGFLSKGEFSTEDQSIPLISQLISTAASFVNPFVAARAAKTVSAETLPDDKDRCMTIYNELNTITAKKREYLLLDKFTNAGELPSKELHEKTLLELEKIENDLFSQLMFSVEIKTEKLIMRYKPLPNSNLTNYITKIFKFEAKDGKPKFTVNKDVIAKEYVIASSGLEPVFETLSKDSSSCYSLNINSDGGTVNDTLPGHSNMSEEEGGLFYNIPTRCQVYITDSKDKKIKQSEIDIPQWGKVGRLSQKMSKLNVVLNPLTGALVSVSGESKGLSAEQIKALGASFESARDVFYTDDLTKIDKQIQRLEKQAKLDSFNKSDSAQEAELKRLKMEKELLTEKKNILEVKNAIRKLEKDE